MTDDATLSDFGVDATGERDGSSADGSEGDKRDPPSAEGDERDGSAGTRADPNPSLSTYAWGEHVCARCNEESERVWRDGEEFVCPDCKEW